MNIILGQYYPVDSVVHRLEPRVKLIGVFVYILGIFIADGFAEYGFAALFTAVVIYLTNVPVKMFFNGLKGLFMIIVFTAVMNVFFVREGNVLIEAGIIKITEEGVKTAVKLIIRLVLLVSGSSVLTLTTTPVELTGALESVLKPLNRVGVPVHEIAMTMTIALRFIPTLMEELDKIKKAQTARGVDFDEGGIREKAMCFIPLLVPLFISAFRRADELADAMEARGYKGGVGRTKMKVCILNKTDYFAAAIMGLYIIVILLRLFL